MIQINISAVSIKAKYSITYDDVNSSKTRGRSWCMCYLQKGLFAMIPENNVLNNPPYKDHEICH